MDNEFLTRKDLSLKAKGLLACMLCLPPDWRFSIEGLAYINKESESAISSALRELEQFDYLRRSYPRTEDGKIANAVYTICDIPIGEYETLHGESDDALNLGVIVRCDSLFRGAIGDIAFQLFCKISA